MDVEERRRPEPSTPIWDSGTPPATPDEFGLEEGRHPEPSKPIVDLCTPHATPEHEEEWPQRDVSVLPAAEQRFGDKCYLMPQNMV